MSPTYSEWTYTLTLLFLLGVFELPVTLSRTGDIVLPLLVMSLVGEAVLPITLALMGEVVVLEDNMLPCLVLGDLVLARVLARPFLPFSKMRLSTAKCSGAVHLSTRSSFHSPVAGGRFQHLPTTCQVQTEQPHQGIQTMGLTFSALAVGPADEARAMLLAVLPATWGREGRQEGGAMQGYDSIPTPAGCDKDPRLSQRDLSLTVILLSVGAVVQASSVPKATLPLPCHKAPPIFPPHPSQVPDNPLLAPAPHAILTFVSALVGPDVDSFPIHPPLGPLPLIVRAIGPDELALPMPEPRLVLARIPGGGKLYVVVALIGGRSSVSL